MSKEEWTQERCEREYALRSAPAVARNRLAIASEIRADLPCVGTVLEIASGTGEHIVYFGDKFRNQRWQPSDCDPAALTTISARLDLWQLPNVAPPICLDAASLEWPVKHAGAILCINMVHISPWAATLGLMAGAGRTLDREIGAPLILYGPFIEADVPTAPSNIAFDQSLRTRDAAWGLRHTADVIAAAADAGLRLTRRVEMPANNLMLVFRAVR